MNARISLALSLAVVGAVLAGEVPAAHAKCSLIECGTNSPVIDSLPFHELNELGLPNDIGLRLRHLVAPDGTHYAPDVVGGRLVGRGSGGAVVIEHAGLTGSYLELFSSSGGMYKLYVDHVTLAVPFLVGAAASAPAETYELNYTGPNTTMKTPMCSMPPRGVVGNQVYKEAVLFSGERFVSSSKRVRTAAADDTSWFNVGCYSHVLWKLYFTRHTIPSSALGFAVSTLRHQAMLKMYVGDVCGSGDAFTTNGTSLFWNNPPYGWGPAELGQAVLEGVWGPNGALCVNDYRKGATYYQTTVMPACGSLLPPTCTAAFPSLSPLPAPGYVFTTIPQALP